MKELLENLQGFVETNIELAKLEVQEKINESVQKVIKVAGLFIFSLLFILFFFIFLALLISSFFKSYVIGFGIITAILLITALLFFYFFKQNKTDEIEEILEVED
jgi:amino acid permease